MSVAPLPTTPTQEPTRKDEGEALYKRLAAPLKTPILIDLRRRCAEALKAAGAPERYIAAVLAVALEVPVRTGSAE